MSDLIERGNDTEQYLLNGASGDASHPDYYHAEVVHHLIKRIAELEASVGEWSSRWAKAYEEGFDEAMAFVFADIEQESKHE